MHQWGEKFQIRVAAAPWGDSVNAYGILIPKCVCSNPAAPGSQSTGRSFCVGFIIGFPHDTPETVRHDIEIVKRELPADLVEFFVLTPVPGSEDSLGIALQRQAASLSRNGTWSIKK
jgi:hypothetical protein